MPRTIWRGSLHARARTRRVSKHERRTARRSWRLSASRAGVFLASLVLLALTAARSGSAIGPAEGPAVGPAAGPAPALQDLPEPPFRLPFRDPPGPDTWLLGQPYGNTIGAYYRRSTTYFAGQGLHFGIDLSARCGTPIVAIGDGVVAKVDAAQHGSAPHNLMIDHPNGLASFYGHLLERPSLVPGQAVLQGEVVALVGDPDETCTSRPHLHLEIRNAGLYNRAYNPIPLISADWDTLALTGGFSPGFARDLGDPRRWQRLDDQTEVIFGGALLNDYPNPWPLEWTR